MSAWQAFFVVMYWLGMLAVGYFTVEFIARHRHWRRVARRNRRWPREQHRSYFSDCRRVPEDDIP